MPRHGATPRDDISPPPAAPVEWKVLNRPGGSPIANVYAKTWHEARTIARRMLPAYAERLDVVLRDGGRVA